MAQATPDLSEFEALSEPRRPPCKVGRILEDLPDAERKQLEAALSQDTGIITNAAILKWLERRDLDGLSSSAATSHRKGTCTCARA